MYAHVYMFASTSYACALVCSCFAYLQGDSISGIAPAQDAVTLCKASIAQVKASPLFSEVACLFETVVDRRGGQRAETRRMSRKKTV